MIMIINKLIALLPNPRQEVFHTRQMEPVPMWIVPDWFAVLLERVDSRRRLRSTVRRTSMRLGASSIPAPTADVKPFWAPASICSLVSSALGTAACANRRHHLELWKPSG